MNMDEKKSYYACKRMRVLSYLTEQGFKYDFVLPDKRNRDRIIWMFPRTNALTAALDAYFDKRRKKHEEVQ